MIPISRNTTLYYSIKSIPWNSNRYSMVSFKENSKVPNFFRSTDLKMKFWITKMSKGKVIPFSDLIDLKLRGIWELHIASGSIQIIQSNGKETSILPTKTSYRLLDLNCLNKFEALQHSTLIAWEFRENPSRNYNPKLYNPCLPLDDIEYFYTIQDIKHRKSFLKRYLSENEIREKLIFIDAEFTVKNEDRTKSPVSVAILDYDGNILLHTKVNPRGRVLDFGTKYHGITEFDTRNQMDEYDCIRKIQEISRDKIIVGHDLNMELRWLAISVDQVLGIRDLCNAPVLFEMEVPRKNNGAFFSLKLLAKYLCDINIHETRQHDAMVDTNTILTIYKKLEKSWKDHNVLELR